MKNGKNPTVEQKKLLKKNGLNCAEWLVVKDLQNSMVVVHRDTREFRMVEK